MTSITEPMTISTIRVHHEICVKDRAVPLAFSMTFRELAERCIKEAEEWLAKTMRPSPGVTYAISQKVEDVIFEPSNNRVFRFSVPLITTYASDTPN